MLGCSRLLAFTILVLGARPGCAADTRPDPPGFDPNRHLHIDDVREGMKGYGMTVFRGITIEPFNVEVVSVQYAFDPGQAVVWVRCPDERMQQTGPVQGMSGSPIYLWKDDGPHKPGEGGLLLGAFAFGHRLGKDCYVGVQPIEQMLDAASRAKKPEGAHARARGSDHLRMHLAASFELARDLKLTEDQAWRLRAIAKLVGYKDEGGVAESADPLTPMSLPVIVGGSDQVKFLTPYLRPLGLNAQAAPSALPSNRPPSWIDPQKATLRPGSVFAVPMVFGPLEMDAIGTTTDVLPDGTVLAFGHAFFGDGPIAVPMAGGFVHFIQPNISASFKLGGSLGVAGTLVRDEQTGVIGKPEKAFTTTPLRVSVQWPEPGLNRVFDYQIVDLPRMVPSLVGSTVSASLTPNTNLPMLNTLSIGGKFRFANGWELPINEVQTAVNPARLGMTLAVPIGPLLENEFGQTKLESAEVTVKVEEEVRAAQIMGATVEQTTVRPGGRLVAHVRMLPYRGAQELKRVEVKVPDDLADGPYVLSISGAQVFHDQRMMLRPHLAKATSGAELFGSIAHVLALRDDALYTSLRLRPNNNLAIGRTELPRLPGSRVAILAAEGSTRTTQYLDSIDVETVVPYVVHGGLAVQVEIRRNISGAP